MRQTHWSDTLLDTNPLHQSTQASTTNARGEWGMIAVRGSKSAHAHADGPAAAAAIAPPDPGAASKSKEKAMTGRLPLMSRKDRPRHATSSSSSSSATPESREGAAAADGVVVSDSDSAPAAARDPSAELTTVLAVCATQYTNECLFGAAAAEGGSASPFSPGVLDPDTWRGIPQYSKSDVVVGRHLGTGSFSDAFEVIVPVAAKAPDLTGFATADKGGDVEAQVAADDDLDAQIDAMFGAEATSAPVVDQGDGQAKAPDCARPSLVRLTSSSVGLSTGDTPRQASRRNVSMVHVRKAAPVHNNQTLYAMKCLRPKIRSDVEQFLIGIEDLIHETAILANLDHPHVIKLHGRAASAGATTKESVVNAFTLSDGYFILLDRLQETLEERIGVWRTAARGDGVPAPWPHQLAAAGAVADALAHLHARRIVYRDLKSANVGFDAAGTPKLFDFGFAVALPAGDGRLRGICGTPRYMAPEVGLGKEYGAAADVHSFGVLLWEIVALETAFRSVKNRKEMHRVVYVKGRRPKLARHWPKALKDAMRGCWREEPEKRPAMDAVAALLRAHAEESRQPQHRTGSLRNGSLMRRLRGSNK